MAAKHTKETAAPRSSYRERNSTADRTLDILGLFTPTRLRVSAQQVADELDVARSTAYRYLQTLSAEGYIEESPEGGFRLGLKVFELARVARQSFGLSAIAVPVLRGLAEATGETALLTRRSGDRAICLEREESSQHWLRVSYERGSTLALNAGASALVLLAWDDPVAVDSTLTSAPLPHFTDNTTTDQATLVQQLAVIRQQGYAVTRGELDPEAIGIAAPIRDEHGRVLAGISLVAVSRRVPDERVDELVTLVRSAADQISGELSLVSQ